MARSRTVGQSRREEGLFKLPRPAFHTVGFFRNRDGMLHVGYVVGGESYNSRSIRCPEADGQMNP